MAAIAITELIPSHLEDRLRQVTPLPAELGTAKVEFDQDDYGRPMTTVTLESGQYAGKYLYAWTEDGQPLNSTGSDPESGLDYTPHHAALVTYTETLHANYAELVQAAIWNLVGNADFKAAIASLAR